MNQADLKIPLDAILSNALNDMAEAYQVNIEFHDFAEDYLKFKRAKAHEIYCHIRDLIKQAEKDSSIIISPLLIDKVLDEESTSKAILKETKNNNSAASFLQDIEQALQSLESNRPSTKGKITKNEIAIELRHIQAIYTSSKESHLRQYFYQLRKKYKSDIQRLLSDPSYLAKWPLTRKHKIFSKL